MYKYIAFGLKINSEIPFPELLPFEHKTSDLQISLGEVPEKLKGEATLAEELMAINDTELWWDIPEVSKYYAYEGRMIIVQPYQGIDDRSVRLYLLATVMAALLNQRNQLTLHAAAVKLNDKLSIITGESGAGKSTTISSLLKKGYQIFSDDVLVLEEVKNDPIRAISSYPMIKLWEDAIVKLDDERFNDRSFNIAPGMEKYGIFFHDKFDANAYPIERIFIIKIKESGPIESRYLENVEAFSALNTYSTYRDNLLFSNHLRQLNFNMLVKLVQQSFVVEIQRPKDCPIETLLSTVESYLK